MVALDKQADLVNTQIDVLFYGLVILIAAMLLTCIFLDRSLWLQLVQLWVFLDVAWRLPKRIARFVTVRLLGDLSCIYNQVLCERFAIGEQCGGVAARLLSVSSTFADLADEQGVADRLEGGISRQRLGERLEAVLGKWGVGPQSVDCEHLTSCCFHAVCGHATRLRTHIKAREARPNPKKQVSDLSATGDGPILLDGFTASVASDSAVELPAVLQLFNRNRRPRLMEFLFMPRDLRQLHDAAFADRRSSLKGAKVSSKICENEACSNAPIDDDGDANPTKHNAVASEGLDLTPEWSVKEVPKVAEESGFGRPGIDAVITVEEQPHGPRERPSGSRQLQQRSTPEGRSPEWAGHGDSLLQEQTEHETDGAAKRGATDSSDVTREASHTLLDTRPSDLFGATQIQRTGSRNSDIEMVSMSSERSTAEFRRGDWRNHRPHKLSMEIWSPCGSQEANAMEKSSPEQCPDLFCQLEQALQHKTHQLEKRCVTLEELEKKVDAWREGARAQQREIAELHSQLRMRRHVEDWRWEYMRSRSMGQQAATKGLDQKLEQLVPQSPGSSASSQGLFLDFDPINQIQELCTGLQTCHRRIESTRKQVATQETLIESLYSTLESHFKELGKPNYTVDVETEEVGSSTSGKTRSATHREQMSPAKSLEMSTPKSSPRRSRQEAETERLQQLTVVMGMCSSRHRGVEKRLRMLEHEVGALRPESLAAYAL